MPERKPQAAVGGVPAGHRDVRDPPARVIQKLGCEQDRPDPLGGPVGIVARLEFYTPSQLARRLAQVGIVEAADAPRLQKRLATGKHHVGR